MKLLYILFTGLFLINTTSDVTTQTVLYHSNKRTETSSGIMYMDLNRILIKDKSKIEWQDGHSVAKYVFDIKSVTGSLSLDGTGEITYQVTSEKVTGRFVVKKTDSKITINALLIEDKKLKTIEFEITNYTIIN